MSEWYVALGVFLFSSLILIKAASLSVKYISHLAKQVHLSEFMASFVLAGAVSILPEFFIGVNAAFSGVTDVGIGALIGNNIVDLTLVVGILLILGKDLPTPKKGRMPTIPFVLATAFPFMLMLDGVISSFDGIILIIVAVSYFAWMISREKIRENDEPINWGKLAPTIGLFFLMMTVIYFASGYVVDSSVDLSIFLGIPEIFAGLIIISLGAALPELTFSAQAVMSRHKSVALGDILGNVALDATISIGIMALIRPIIIPFGTIGISTLIMVFAAIMLTTFMDHNGHMTRRDGIALIGLYVVFVVVQLTMSAISGGTPALGHT